MRLTRKEFLALTGQAATGWTAGTWLAPGSLSAQSLKSAKPAPLEQRIARLIQAYDQQGIHRTGTATRSGLGALVG
ncbi:MAG: hypothetical protein ACKV2V_20640 [Blastocatellia bacterium]